MKMKDIKAALALFEESAIEYAEATEQGNNKIGNKCYGNIVKAISFLKEQGEIIKLVDFLNHPSVGVRNWAATYLLSVREKEAVKTLEGVVKRNDIHSFIAETTLSEWRKGNLTL